MTFKRINGRVDINHELVSGNIVKDEEEQRGVRTNKFWFNNYEYLYKDIYRLTHEDYAEMIAYELANHLGIKCAEYDLAIYNGNLGVITKNLITDNENEELLSGTEIITQVYTEYIAPINKAMEEYKKLICETDCKDVFSFTLLPDEEQFAVRKKLINIMKELSIKKIEDFDLKDDEIDYTEIDRIYEYLDSFYEIYNEDFIEVKNGIIKSNNLYDIWSVLEIYSKINNLDMDIPSAMENLINMFVFDIITSQGDRHADNWSIIKNSRDNTIRLCPLYDNSGICSLHRENAIKNIVEYVNSMNNVKLNEHKKAKLNSLLDKTINHSNSGLKVDLEDVNTKNKNRIMVEKFITHSSDEFSDKMFSFAAGIDDLTLTDIFSNIEVKTGVSVPEDVKLITKTVLMHNVEMIKELYSERRVLR